MDVGRVKVKAADVIEGRMPKGCGGQQSSCPSYSSPSGGRQSDCLFSIISLSERPGKGRRQAPSCTSKGQDGPALSLWFLSWSTRESNPPAALSREGSWAQSKPDVPRRAFPKKGCRDQIEVNVMCTVPLMPAVEPESPVRTVRPSDTVTVPL